MKKLLPILLVCFTVQMLAQKDVMFEFVTIDTQGGNHGGPDQPTKTHNDTYHKENPYGARVYSVNTGAQTGKLMWVMGPTTGPIWTKDRVKEPTMMIGPKWKRLPKIKLNVEYFRFEPSLSNFSKDFDIKNIGVRFTDLKQWQGYRYRTLMEKLQKVYAEKLPDQQRGIYWNTMGNYTDGRDVMTALFHDGLDWMDEEQGLTTKYEEVHGAGSWRDFMSEIEDIVEGSDILMLSLVPEMGGLTPRIIAAERN